MTLGKSLWYQGRHRLLTDANSGGFSMGLSALDGTTTFDDAIHFEVPENSTELFLVVRDGGVSQVNQSLGLINENQYYEMAFWFDGLRLELHAYLDGNEVAVIPLVIANTPFGIPLTPTLRLTEAGAETPELYTDYMNVGQER